MNAPSKKPLRAILVHGMGRTPAAMLVLAARLRAAGLRSDLFAYSAALEGWEGCVGRLRGFIDRRAAGTDFVVVGHSLGAVLLRAALPRLARPPVACFLLAPPTQASLAARRFAPRRLYRLLTGEMGQKLASQPFMDALPLPAVPTRIYAGTGGPRGRHAFFGSEPNDGVLAVAETRLADIPLQTVPSLHTFIMNSRAVAEDIVRFAGARRTAGEGAQAV
ncbi:MAG: alpha/beta fold hydrolase [Rhodocyclales bacterium]|nr:alpha/beta fold hydrolase [Rhodocyclales bacterium]